MEKEAPHLPGKPGQRQALGSRRAYHEEVKHAVETTLSTVARSETGRRFLRYVSGSEDLQDDRLLVAVADIEFPNPVMVGAGWDKEGRAVAGLEAVGFGGVEIGTVPVYPQPGNDNPRLWTRRGPGGRVSLNRMGFNSRGMEAVKGNLDRNADYTIPVGVSLGKNKLATAAEAPAQHARVAEYLYQYADYFVINVSSPNTPGLRELQDKGPLTEIVLAVKDALDRSGGQKPILIKIAPELTPAAIDDVIEVVRTHGLAGIVGTNTTTDEETKASHGWENEPGGLAGADPRYRKRSTEVVRYAAESAEGQYDVIGVGGIDSAEAALEKIYAGASVVQVVTAIREKHVRTATSIVRGILDHMERYEIDSLEDIRGTGAPS